MGKSIFLQRLSATVQFVLGFILGITLIAGAAVSAGYLYYQRMSILPKKPVFPEETKSTATKPVESPKQKSEDTPAETQETSEVESSTETETETKEIEAELPPNAYKAQVTWPQGLSLRSEPSLNAGRIGGISYNATIIILEDTSDNQWQRVRIPWSGQEGWVKGGNTKRISY
ncbi:MAG: hypothetical protein Tsb0014_19910 [Pleurocapsa sp.]